MTQAHVVHHIEGSRMRLKVPHKRHNHAFFHELKRRLNAIGNVEAEVNPATSSVLIRYAGPSGELLDKLVDAGVDELLDVELGPLGAVVGGALPISAKLVLVAGLLTFGWFSLEL